MKDIYPLTICKDRYTGSYSGCQYHAWNLTADQVPMGWDDGDCEAMDFWHENKLPVGKGNTPQDAVKDLSTKLKD